MDTITSTRQYAQAMSEYSLVLALVAVVAIAGLLVFGDTVSVMISKVSTSVTMSV